MQLIENAGNYSILLESKTEKEVCFANAGEKWKSECLPYQRGKDSCLAGRVSVSLCQYNQGEPEL